MLTLSKPISAGQAQAYHKSEFANAKLAGSNALALAESILGNNLGLAGTALGGAAGNSMSGHKCGCQ